MNIKFICLLFITFILLFNCIYTHDLDSSNNNNINEDIKNETPQATTTISLNENEKVEILLDNDGNNNNILESEYSHLKVDNTPQDTIEVKEEETAEEPQIFSDKDSTTEKKSVEMVVDRDILCDPKLTKEEHDQVIEKVLRDYFGELSPNTLEYTSISSQFSNYLKNNICKGYKKKNTKSENGEDGEEETAISNTALQTPAATSAKTPASLLAEAVTVSTTTTAVPNTAITKITEWPKESNYVLDYSTILELTENNIERVIKENQFVYVLFYAPWCSRSQTLLPEFKEAHRLYYESSFQPPILFAMANCHKYPIIRDKQSIGGYPVMELFRRSGGHLIPRGSSSQPATMIQFLRRNTLPSLEFINSIERFENFSNVVPYALVGLFPNSNSSSALMFNSLSKNLAYKFPCSFINDTELIQNLLKNHFKLDNIEEGIVLIKPLEKSYTLYDQEYKLSILLRWLSASYSPIINELTPDSIHRVISNKIKQSFLLFLNLSNSTATLSLKDRPFSKDLSNLLSVSNQINHQINLYYVDGITFSDFAERLGVTKLPQMVIIDFNSEEFFTTTNTTEPSTILKFIDDFSNDKLIPYKYSQGQIEIQDNKKEEEIQYIVYNNFNSIVLESKNKNSLVYFNAPWCGFCKTMNIYFKEASKKLKEQYGDSLQILIYDVEKNSIPIIMKPHISTYPYISLFKLTDLNNPISYNLTRDLNSIIEFVNINLQNNNQQQQEQQEKTIEEVIIEKDIIHDFQIHSLDESEKEIS